MFDTLKQLFEELPTWFKIVIVVTLVVGVTTYGYTISKCGFWKTTMLGNGAFFAAQSGMCDE